MCKIQNCNRFADKEKKMIYITGDCHSEFYKFSTSSFPEQKQMTKDDIVIICGDFGGIWDLDKNSSFESYWLKWLDEKPFTTLFVDGNHENFSRLNSEFETVTIYGGKAHKIMDSIYHLLRGEVYEIEGKRFFAFGGASSHDIKDGIIKRENFRNNFEFKETIRRLKKQRKKIRIYNVSWWEEELPDESEFQHAEDTLKKFDYSVDYVITHCAPQSVVNMLADSEYKPDKLTEYFDDLAGRMKFKLWFFGHYHYDKKINDKFIILYDQIIRII